MHRYGSLWFLLWCTITILTFLWGYTGLPPGMEVYGKAWVTWIAIARGMAMVTLLQSVLVLVPVLYRSMKWCRTWTWLEAHFPFDAYRFIHILMGGALLVAGFIHTVAQLLAFAQSPTNPLGVYSWASYLKLWPVWTGFAILFLWSGTIPLTHPKIRKMRFNWFWNSHRVLYLSYYILLVVHGAGSYLAPSRALWFIPAIVFFYLYDRRDRLWPGCCRQTSYLLPHSVHFYPHVMRITLKRPPGFRTTTPGMFVYLNIPALARFEWHPFTLATVVLENDTSLCLMIACPGDWTTEFRRLLYHSITSSPAVACHIDGPIGAPTQLYTHYDVIMLIAGGVGIVPFLSILDSWARQEHCNGIPETYLYWGMRNEEHFFEDLTLRSLPSQCHVHQFVTVPKGGYARHPLCTGRPNWNRVFSNIAAKHGGKTVGVFFCGPVHFQRCIEEQCRKMSKESTAIFELHAELFAD